MIQPLPGAPSLSAMGGERLGEAQGTIGSGGRRLWLYPKEVTGRFTVNRNRVAWVLMAVYLGTPWLSWQGTPLILLDWAGRKVVLLGNNFWAKDIPLLLPLFFAFVLAVFLVTARFGRIWCGWACPQTVFLQFAFAPIEKLFEGKASRRKARDAGPWNLDRAWRKAGKHAAFAILSWWIGNTALAYFWGAGNLVGAMAHPSAENMPGLALALAFAAVFYGNFAFFKEQACIMVCPYARFQSVLPDEDTALIAYDAARGEKRGKGARGSREGLGDCTDCRQCVLVCPTGIDIRQGQQLECIGCARCIDACDKTMAAWKKPKGLVRYASLAALEGRKRSGRPWRLFAYGALAVIMVAISGILLAARPAVSVDAVRRGSAPYARVGADSVLNTFSLHLRNNGSAQRILRLEWAGTPAGACDWEGRVFALPAGGAATLPLDVIAPVSAFSRGRLETGMILIDDSVRGGFRMELAGPWGK
ncbi:MAG TPA: cytochrome c oxidase accessory protein CcoG [Fibrobacteria bacterium]|nr:cytochrome c oxidase accessory protein CcoG [Fibrobacteria bacterium]